MYSHYPSCTLRMIIDTDIFLRDELVLDYFITIFWIFADLCLYPMIQWHDETNKRVE